ncbi:MAG: galactokinase [Chloroflexota bacterium]
MTSSGFEHERALSEQFAREFGRTPELFASAPGRVNLIGEHTDYNDGFVLPLAVPLRTRVALAKRDDDLALASSRERDDGHVAEYQLGRERRGAGWLDYVQGVTSVLRSAGHQVGGFCLALESDVPLGSGLASSAALLVAVARALREAFALEIDDVTLARLAQRAEVDFVGARVGIMDQLCASLGDERHALFVDTRSLAYERVPFPESLELAVIGSGVSHSNVAGEYNARRSECERACELLGVAALRDVTLDDMAKIEALPPPLAGRARHVVAENQRVLETVAALREGRLDDLGPLLAASHRSMRDDYQVSVGEIDLLVELADARPEVIGARLTGGGFGGSIVVVTAAGQAREAGRAIVDEYVARTGRAGRLLVPAAEGSS